MAQFSLTFQQLKNEAQHAIGGTPDSLVTLDSLVNGALEHFCQVHPWQWRIVLATLNTVGGVGEIDLPADFGELIDLVGFQLKLTAVRKASHQTVVRVRVHGLSSDQSLVYYLGQKAQATPGTVPVRQLVIAPVPTTSTTNALYLTYRRLIPTLTNNTDVPAVPYGMFELLRWLVRGWARMQTTGDGGADMMQFQRMLPDYIAADAVADSPRQGAMIDAVNELEPDGIFTLAPHTEIAMPGDP
ncbi:hypothetical protein [Fontivita pretiosa]|uniref:phage adaptor protein n=1 Tax=Fontivita pretiosa TaxID=2989684 RepID=UPI003D17786D